MRLRHLPRLVFFLVALIIVGGGAFLATWDVPAPSSMVEKVVPNEKFPK